MYKEPEITRKFLSEIPNHIERLDYEQVKKLCNSMLPAIPVQVVDFNNEKFFFNQHELGGFNGIYRAREITNPKNTPYKTVSEISYIPENLKHKLTDFGRANKPCEPMFYGSLNYATACTEAITNAHDFLSKGSTMMTVGKWIFEKPLTLVQLPYSEKVFKKFYETVNFKSEKIQLEHIEKINAESRQYFRSDIEFEVLNFFADEFAKFDNEKEHKYKISNYYTDRIFNRIPGFELPLDIDGIIYPSISLSYQEKNIVLKPDVIDTKLRFSDAMQVWVVSHKDNGGGGEFIPIEQGVRADKDGNLNWR